MAHADAIHEFCSWFDEQLKRVLSVQDPLRVEVAVTDRDTIDSTFLYRKILIVTMLASWARVRHPTAQGDKDKFTSLIRTCADWPDCDRVSLPQLSFLLRANSIPADNQLAREVEMRLQEWPFGDIYNLDNDPWPQELEAFATTECERGCIKNSRHAELLYSYRCALVHEFTEPGSSPQFRAGMPHYYGWGDAEDSTRWALIYPMEFFQSIAEQSLTNLKRYLLKSDVDPFSSFDDSQLWYRKPPQRSKKRKQP
jgi:hypothetical protein